MRATLIGFLASVFALPMGGYVQFKYIFLGNETIANQGLKAPKLHEERKVNLVGTKEFQDWIEAAVDDVENKSSNVDYRALVGVLATYLFLKLFSRIVRFVTVTTLITLSL